MAGSAGIAGIARAATIALAALPALAALIPLPAAAGDALEGWRWKQQSTEIVAEGIFWNDFLADGQDRWKSGGITQSFTLPERIFDRDPWTPWLANRASGIEIQARGLVVTPDNTAAAGTNDRDRPYAQYLGVGAYFRSDTRPRPSVAGTTLSVEDRVGVEVGWIGEPLFFFEAQDALHEVIGMGATQVSDDNSVGAGVLANLEARRTWRYHRDMGAVDVEAAPYIDISAGLRENSARIGANFFAGGDLSARHWNMDPAIGAVIPGSKRRIPGFDWAVFAGADIGSVAQDALLGGVAGLDGPKAEPKTVVARARAGVVMGYGKVSLSYGLNWLSPEFEDQEQGQLIGSAALKIDF